MVRRLKDDVLDLLPAMEETLPLEPTQRYWKVEEGELAFIDGILSDNPQSKKKRSSRCTRYLQQQRWTKSIGFVNGWLPSWKIQTRKSWYFISSGLARHCTPCLKSGVFLMLICGEPNPMQGDHTFQTTPECRVALCSYSMAREAVTLTEAAYQLRWNTPGFRDGPSRHAIVHVVLDKKRADVLLPYLGRLGRRTYCQSHAEQTRYYLCDYPRYSPQSNWH